ncbi:hypothetical protein BHE74_00025727 [Ensete ventricosum]|nr:hypothetical protein GW17_00048406 [Ensete ventricosum]RWW66872.1 hypothetical protein BHE74_00025727 [Ensete ventricosum]
MASDDMIDAKLKAIEMHMEDKLCALFVEFGIGRSPSPMKSQQGEISNHKERPPEKEEQTMDSAQPCMMVDFPRWEEGNPTGWLTHAKRYFRYHKTPDASMVNIVVIHLEGDVIQWYEWFKDIHRVPIWRQFKKRAADPL